MREDLIISVDSTGSNTIRPRKNNHKKTNHHSSTMNDDDDEDDDREFVEVEKKTTTSGSGEDRWSVVPPSRTTSCSSEYSCCTSSSMTPCCGCLSSSSPSSTEGYGSCCRYDDDDDVDNIDDYCCAATRAACSAGNKNGTTVAATAASTATTTSTRTRSSSSSRRQRWLIMRGAWAVQWLVAVVVLSAGAWRNGGRRKYVLVEPSRVEGLEQCQKVFVNVFANDGGDPDAIVCCDDKTLGHSAAAVAGSATSAGPVSSRQVLADLCPNHHVGGAPQPLPLSGRLTRLPDACLIPLFPILVRALFGIAQVLSWLLPQPFSASAAAATTTRRTNSSIGSFFALLLPPATLLRRLGLYIVLTQVRGWLLYVALNRLEDVLVKPIPETCWYGQQPWYETTSCYGRVFDFSDHVVLYFAQLVPIPLVEVLHALIHEPYWLVPRAASGNNNNNSTNGNWSLPSRLLGHWVPRTLVAGMLYLYVITLLGTYKTAAYFHTGSEVLTGFAVSMLIHVPLFYLQCGAGDSSRARKLRAYFFGHSSGAPPNAPSRAVPQQEQFDLQHRQQQRRPLPSSSSLSSMHSQNSYF